MRGLWKASGVVEIRNPGWSSPDPDEPWRRRSEVEMFGDVLERHRE